MTKEMNRYIKQKGIKTYWNQEEPGEPTDNYIKARMDTRKNLEEEYNVKAAAALIEEEIIKDLQSITKSINK